VTTDAAGRLVKSADQVKTGEKLLTRVAEGEISSVVE